MQPELVRSCNTHSDPAPRDGRPPQRGRPSPNARSALGGADAAEELIDLPAQRFNLARGLARMVAHHLRRLAGLAGRAGKAGDLLAHHVGAVRDPMHVLRHFAGRRVLLLDGGRDRGRDLVDARDPRADMLDRRDRVVGRVLDRLGLGGNVLGRGRGLRRKRLHLGGDDRKALAGLPGARPLDRGIERQQVGLAGDRLIISSTSPILVAASARPRMVARVVSASFTAVDATAADSPTLRPISLIEAESSSAADATECTLSEACCEAEAAEPASTFAPEATSAMAFAVSCIFSAEPVTSSTTALTSLSRPSASASSSWRRSCAMRARSAAVCSSLRTASRRASRSTLSAAAMSAISSLPPAAISASRSPAAMQVMLWRRRDSRRVTPRPT